MIPLPDRRCHQETPPRGDCPSIASLFALLECVPAMLWETDAELRFTSMIGGALEALGISAEAYEGKSLDDLFPDSSNARQTHEAALQGSGGVFEADVRGRVLEAKVRPRLGLEGSVSGVIGIALDRTERSVAQRALRLSEHGYRTLIEEAPYAICRATIGGELLQVNRAMTEMLGYDASSNTELLLRDLPLIFTPAGSFEAFQKELLERDRHPGMEAVWTRRDGRPIQVRVSGCLVRGPAGEVSHFDLFAENVTEVKRLEGELGQAQRMQAIGQLAGGVAHDFNNLLTVISGHVEVMLDDPRGAESRQHLVEVRQAADRAAALTRQLLAFSRRQVLHSRRINLNDVIRDLMGMLTRVIKESVELTFEPGEELGDVKADPNEIERVLLNLAVNAQDAMPWGGRLAIRTRNTRVEDPAEAPGGLTPGDYVEIEVRDTGVGMDREAQAHAFEPFFSTKPPSEGAGLGLAVVYGVVRQSGGCVLLESEPNAGTTFRIYLPRVGGQPEGARATATAAPMPRGSETILFAEDDPAIRRLVARTLEGLGYRVLSAPDGIAAMSLAHSYAGEIQVLLSDLVMPTVGGRELAASLKDTDPNLKVIFTSGYAGNSISEKDLEPPGTWFLQKPFSMDTLARTVRRILDGSVP